MSSPMSPSNFMSQLISPDLYSNYRPGPSVEDAVRDLGVLGDLVGTWMGVGFNMVTLPAFGPKKNNGAREEFRVVADATHEIMEFDPIGAPFPNRGSFKEPDSHVGQHDINIYGVRYRQRVANAETHQPMHMESGFWLLVPETEIPPLPETLVRQAVIPHGNSLLALGPSPQCSDKAPCFDLASPFPDVHVGRRPDLNPGYLHDFLHPDEVPRLKKVFEPLIVKVESPPAPSTKMLDANQTLRKVIDGQKFIKTVTLKVSAQNPDKPRRESQPEIDEFKKHGRIANIPFLAAKNADVTEFESTFWIETVQSVDKKGASVGPKFLQLQYSQRVILDFLGIDWPHISVATLIKQ
jgi:hypothetical protein